METNGYRRVTLAGLFIALSFTSALADKVSSTTTSAPPARVWHYVLHQGSTLTDECLICGRPTVLELMRGSFDLRLLEENTLFREYTVEHIDFLAGSAGGRNYRLRGSGTYRVGGEVALRQEMFLAVDIDDGFTNKLCYFTNVYGTIERLWPMIAVTLQQTNGTTTQEYTLNIDASPLRDIWFSTLAGMTLGNRPPPSNHVSGGDLLSFNGRVVKTNHELTERLGVMPIVGDVGLDAVDLLPGGEIAFSIEQDVFSETLGPIHHGDLLSNRGQIIKRNQQLTAAFGIMPPVPDVGLDAVQVRDNGEIYFSIETDIFAEGKELRSEKGDLLSDQGRIVKRNSELIQAFHPTNASVDVGLDAVYVWPSGEIWFSIDQGFTGENLESYRAGDLLSDQGYVVYRNLELVGAFAPIEDLADFGLDALFIVSDVTANAPPPNITHINRKASTGTTDLEWTGLGRVWQVLGSPQLPGNFSPRSPIIPDTTFQDTGSASNAVLFYILQQW